MLLKLHFHDLNLVNPFQTAHSQRTVQKTLIVELSSGTHGGFGEATSNTYFNVTRNAIESEIEKLRPWLESLDPLPPFQFHQELSARTKSNFARCALDQAMHDLWGKLNGESTMDQLGIPRHNIPLSDFTIGISDVDHMLEKLRSQPWPIYKIKLNNKLDIDLIKAIRKETDAKIRVDANCAWTAEQTITYAEILLQLRVELIEQPLPRKDWQGMKEVFKYSALPIIADESCETESDVDRCAGYFHGINIKLTKCGGITPAFRMIQHARRLKMDVMIGCMTESTVGISAAAQLAPFLDYADLDGPLLIANDIANGVQVTASGLQYPETHGNGVTMKG